jgi:signal transduction histidine kinase
VTEEYLRLARLPQPRLEADDLGELAESAASFVRKEMDAAGVKLDVEIARGLPLVAMDEPQIRQALLNLLRNAREAMPGGGTIGLRVSAREGGVTVSVHDQGPGIPAEARERIFDLFFTTKESGTGLGLPLTQQIVVAHGGRIRCDSTPGAGTTFDLWLPASPPAAPREDLHGQHQSEGRPEH